MKQDKNCLKSLTTTAVAEKQTVVALLNNAFT